MMPELVNAFAQLGPTIGSLAWKEKVALKSEARSSAGE